MISTYKVHVSRYFYRDIRSKNKNKKKIETPLGEKVTCQFKELVIFGLNKLSWKLRNHKCVLTRKARKKVNFSKVTNGTKLPIATKTTCLNEFCEKSFKGTTLFAI